MVNEKEGYAILSNIAVPISLMHELAKSSFSVDYDYVDNDYEYRPKGSVDNIKLISGQQLVANQVAYRMRKTDKK
jgi:hypothetical protein